MAWNCPVCAWSERGDMPAEKPVHAFPTPPGQVFATYIHKERNYRQKAEDIPSKLSESKMVKRRPALSKRERANGKEVPTMGGYNANHRDIKMILACTVLLLIKYIMKI